MTRRSACGHRSSKFIGGECLSCGRAVKFEIVILIVMILMGIFHGRLGGL